MSTNESVNYNRRNMSKTESSSTSRNTDENKVKTTSNGDFVPMQMISSIVLGLVFGFLMNKANVYLAPIIREQMLFKRLIMIKMFLGAVGMSMLSVSFLILFNESNYKASRNAFVNRNKHIGAFHLILGGSLIGIGMVLAGSCPGTVFIQMGSGLPNSFLTCLGGVCGVLFYYAFLNERLTRQELPKSSIVLQQLPDLIGVKHIYLNSIFGLTFVGVAFALEYFLPYKNDLIGSGRFSTVDGWSPVLCGLGIGLLQLFFMMIFKKSLGVSTGFTVLVAQACRVQAFKKLMPSLESFAHGIQNSLTLLFTLAAIAGSFISTVGAQQFPLNKHYGASAWYSFFGGFLLLVGARCAGGCTSGQGISGVSHMLIGSLMVTAAMFGGGMAFAFSYGLITNDWQFYGI